MLRVVLNNDWQSFRVGKSYQKVLGSDRTKGDILFLLRVTLNPLSGFTDMLSAKEYVFCFSSSADGIKNFTRIFVAYVVMT